MGWIKSASEVNTLAAGAKGKTSGVYFVTAFAGLLAPYWDPGAGGMIIGKAPLVLALTTSVIHLSFS